LYVLQKERATSVYLSSLMKDCNGCLAYLCIRQRRNKMKTMRRRDFLGVLIGCASFLMVGCSFGKLAEEVAKDVGEQLLTDAIEYFLKELITDSCPSNHPVDCRSHCCASGRECCGSYCSTSGSTCCESYFCPSASGAPRAAAPHSTSNRHTSPQAVSERYIAPQAAAIHTKKSVKL